MVVFPLQLHFNTEINENIITNKLITNKIENIKICCKKFSCFVFEYLHKRGNIRVNRMFVPALVESSDMLQVKLCDTTLCLRITIPYL